MSRKKIEIKSIGNKRARDSCFSKRRTTIFNKAKELAILCGARVAAVFFSPRGRLFSFGYPSVSAVANRFLADHGPNNSTVSSSTQVEGGTDAVIRELEHRERELKDELVRASSQSELLREAKMRESGERMMDVVLHGRDEAGLNDLEEAERLLTEVEVIIEERKNKMLNVEG
ncbi:hypothetical protein GUJ93_ZPchr0013g36577 [Zizania palustris]|uniref:MADS-box domain-containing protein n=1 Tax=Zizania palustris TaxID=103762 RepID=A0A8J6BXW3_ZIZPA|nr:hypothetical protein GUJ93_ZPchr0013g36577 [Zizania palustris]